MVGTWTNNYANSSLWLECVRVRIACSCSNLTILSGQTLLFRLVRRKSVETQAPPIGPAFQGPNPPRSHVRSGKMVDILDIQIFPNRHRHLQIATSCRINQEKGSQQGFNCKISLYSIWLQPSIFVFNLPQFCLTLLTPSCILESMEVKRFSCSNISTGFLRINNKRSEWLNL